MQKDKLKELASVRSNPCVTISMNTHRTHPDNAQDTILLKKLLKEAKDRVIKEFGKRNVLSLTEKLDTLPDKIDVNYNLDSLHIFLSSETMEVIKLPCPTYRNVVIIADSFLVRTLISAYIRSEEYLIMLLSQSGVHLYEAINDSIVSEITNSGFPFPENPHIIVEPEKRSDPKQMDNMVREYLNKVDKALVKIHHRTNLVCVVICTEDNYSRLMQVTDNPDIYLSYANINYNNTATHEITTQAWKIIKESQEQTGIEAIIEIKEAVGIGKVITDLNEIFRAAKDGRGDLLMVHNDFRQAVKMTGKYSFDLVDDVTHTNVIDDISSEIAWEVISKNGRVLFTEDNDLKELGNIVLKVRY